jgi:hypothetical protein
VAAAADTVAAAGTAAGAAVANRAGDAIVQHARSW